MTIPTPYGHLAAKWWGRQDVRPVVCLHGWQDNCGSFDTLIPLLPQHVGYLAVDLPGHGLSSFLPDGVLYSFTQHTFVLDYVFRSYFKWQKVSLIAHSMSAVIVFAYSAIFPNYVDLVVALDYLKPEIITENADRFMFGALNGNVLKTDINNMAGVEPPSCSSDELIEKLIQSTGGSINRESALYLLQRGSKQSKINPDRYYFTRDNRMKQHSMILLTDDVNVNLAKRIRCPYLLLKSKTLNFAYVEPPQYMAPVVIAMQSVNPRFELIDIESNSHHMHLVDPEKVWPPIESFINRVRPASKMEVANSKL